MEIVRESAEDCSDRAEREPEGSENGPAPGSRHRSTRDKALTERLRACLEALDH